MEVNKELIQKLADLSKLDLSEAEQASFQGDLANIVKFVEKLNEVDLEGVAPLQYITGEKNVLRPDEVKQEISKDEALKNAPMKDSDYFKVPKVLKKQSE